MNGGGSSPSNITQTTKNEPSPYAAPFLDPFMGQALSVVMKPYEKYPGQTIAPVNPTQQQAFDMTKGIVDSSNQQIGGAQSALSQLIGGPGISVGQNPLLGQNNPYLQNAIDSASSDVVRNFQNATAPGTDAAFARAGAFGGSAWQQAQSNNQHQLAQDLGTISNNMRMQDYNLQAQLGESDLNRQLQAGQLNNAQKLQAIGMAPSLSQAPFSNASALLGVGNQEQQNTQNQLDSAYQQWQQEQQYPYQQLGTMQSALGTVLGAGGTTISSQPNPYQTNPISGVLGGAMGGLGLASQLGMLGGAGAGAGAAAAGGAAGGAASGAAMGAWGGPLMMIGGGLLGALGSGAF